MFIRPKATQPPQRRGGGKPTPVALPLSRHSRLKLPLQGFAVACRALIRRDQALLASEQAGLLCLRMCIACFRTRPAISPSWHIATSFFSAGIDPASDLKLTIGIFISLFDQPLAPRLGLV